MERRKIIFLIFVLLVFFFIRSSRFGQQITLENMQRHAAAFEKIVQAHYGAAVGAYIGAYVIVTGLSIPAAIYLTLAGGFFFGALAATLYVNVGATGGAAIIFLLVRYFIGHWVQEKHAARLAAFNAELDQHGVYYLLSVRLMPVVPFFLVNIMAGLTRISFKTFLWTTSIGIVPGSFAYAYAGRQLKTITSARGILSPNVIGAFLLLGVVALLPVAIKKITKPAAC